MGYRPGAGCYRAGMVEASNQTPRVEQLAPRLESSLENSLRRLDSEVNRTPVVALITACAPGKERERCFASGMNDYLTKPFSRLRLLDVMEQNLR